MRVLALVAAAVAAGCSSGPVTASGCSYEPHNHKPTIVATLTNNTNKPVHHVGVLIGTVEYEFYLKLGPNQTIGRARGSLDAENYDETRVSECWARDVDFDDGSNWNVSPL